MKVYYGAHYLPKDVHKPSEQWWCAVHMTKAVKHGILSANSSCTLTFKDGHTLFINHQNASICRKMFGDLILSVCQDINTLPAVLVPMPSKDGTLDAAGSYRSLDMVTSSVCGKAGLTVLDAVRFTEKLQKASEGGPRSPRILYPKMRVIAQAPATPVVLVDDLVTSLGHMQAACRRLREAGFDVAGGIAWAHTTHDTTGCKPFERKTLEMDENWGFEEPDVVFDLDYPF